MNIGRWIRERWVEARFGLIYAGFILSFVTASTVTYADIPQIHSIFPNLTEYGIVAILLGGFIFSPIVGHLHRTHQNPTDIRVANEPLFREIRRIVREELDRDK